MTTKTWLAAVGCACILAASGMPTQAELEKVQGLVTELMRSDVANFNARKMSAADVATSALKYAGEAQSEASRFLLLKGAFFYRVRAEDYDGAMDVISKIRHDINDVPDATLVKILSSAIRRIPRKSAGRLYDLHQRLQDRVRYAQEVKDLTAKIKAKPSDKSLRTALGERYALLGEWDKALPEFAAGKGRVAKAAALEQTVDAKPGDVADAWWEVAEKESSDISLAYRVHAVRFYRAALADGSLSGLKKPIAAKRIEEVKADGLVDEQDDTGIHPSMAPGKASLRPKPLVFDLGEGVKMEMVGCPRGRGIAWPSTNHTFEITRPFWFGKYPVTVAEWERLMPPAMPPPGIERKNLDPRVPVQHYHSNDPKLGGMTREEAEEFMSKLTEKFRDQIPSGYVFRLPTNAEWTFAAFRADTPDLRELFEHKNEALASSQRRSRYFVQYIECEQYWKARGSGVSCQRPGGLAPYIPVGSKKPNAWGIYDLFGPSVEPFLLTESPKHRWSFGMRYGKCHTNYTRDPLMFYHHGGTLSIGALGFYGDMNRSWGKEWIPTDFKGGRGCKLRLVVAPDLLKERGIMPLSLPDKAAGSK